MINMFDTRGARPDRAGARASRGFIFGAFRRRNGIMISCDPLLARGRRDSLREHRFAVQHLWLNTDDRVAHASPRRNGHVANAVVAVAAAVATKSAETFRCECDVGRVVDGARGRRAAVLRSTKGARQRSTSSASEQ